MVYGFGPPHLFAICAFLLATISNSLNIANGQILTCEPRYITVRKRGLSLPILCIHACKVPYRRDKRNAYAKLKTQYQPKLGLPDPQKTIWKKNLKIFGRCILFVFTVKKRLQKKINSNSPSNFIFHLCQNHILYFSYSYSTLLIV